MVSTYYDAARFLGISLHSAGDIKTLLEEAGFEVYSVQKARREALKGTTIGEKLLEVVSDGGKCENFGGGRILLQCRLGKGWVARAQTPFPSWV